MRGLHPNLREYPSMPGFEVAGTVVAVGPEVTRLQVGQAVMALQAGVVVRPLCQRARILGQRLPRRHQVG